MLDVHAEALANSSPAYHEFLLYYRNDEMHVYGFVEGVDDPQIYRGLIENALPDKWSVKLIPAGNRARVLEILAQMDWVRFPERRICFFVDRDLSEYLGYKFPDAKNLYITDGYSIENSLVNRSLLDRTLDEVLGIRGLEPDEIAAIYESYDEGLRSFREALVPVMAQILVWQRANARPYLENIDLAAWFDFQNGRAILKDEFKQLGSLLTHAGRHCRVEPSAGEVVDAVVNELVQGGSLDGVIRGKYLLWFFVRSVLSIRESIAAFCSKYSTNRPRMRVALGHENAMVVLGSRARLPSSLRQFVQCNYIAFAAGLAS